MTLKIVYRNPVPSGGNVYFIDNVIDYCTRNHELHIWLKGSNPQHDRSDLSFAQGEWIFYEQQITENFTEDSKEKYVPPKRDRHRPDHDEEEPAPETIPPRRASRPSNGSSNGRGRSSDLRDLAVTSPGDVERTQAASVQFAIDNMKVPWSEAHMRAVFDYERAVEKEFGREAVDELPWNKVPRGEPIDDRRRR
jgi:hypothetical protein